MFLKIFTFIFEKLIADLTPEQKEIAWEKFKEILAVLAEAGVKGAAESLKNE